MIETTPDPDAHEQLLRAQSLAGQRRWEAASCVYAAAVEQLSAMDRSAPGDLRVPVSVGLPAELEVSAQLKDPLASTPPGPALAALQAQLAERCGAPQLDSAARARAFGTSAPQRWLLSYLGHSEHAVERAHGQARVTVPLGPAWSFLLALDGDQVCCRPVGAQLAHAYAHLAQSRIERALADNGGAHRLSDDCAHALLAEAPLLARAVVLRPGYAWALAHLGELHRTLAQDWPRSWASTPSRADAGLDFVRALVCFRVAVEHLELHAQRASSRVDLAWTLAHFGATIIHLFNELHPFLDGGPRPPLLLELCSEWFGDPRDGAEEAALIELALASLDRALALRPGYAWAEAYRISARVVREALACGLPKMHTYEKDHHEEH